MLKHVANFCRDEEGATAIEYALIAALVSVAAITALSQLGNSLNDIFTSISNQLSAAAASLTP